MNESDDIKMNLGHGMRSQTEILLDTHGLDIEASNDPFFMVDIGSKFDFFNVGSSSLKIFPGTKTTIRVVLGDVVTVLK